MVWEVMAVQKIISSVIRQKDESQNGCFNITKHAFLSWNTCFEICPFALLLTIWRASSIFKLQKHKGFRQSRKMCRNPCSLRWLKSNLRRVRNFKPFGRKYCMFLSTGKIKDNSLLLNNETDSTFLMLRSKLKQSFRVAYRTVSSNMAKISLGFYIWQNVLQKNILRIKCKVWETRKIFVILHSALCYNYYVLEEVPHIVVLYVG